jgi:hypothetical protein
VLHLSIRKEEGDMEKIEEQIKQELVAEMQMQNI